MLEAPEDEVPPEEIWHHSERLKEWFEAVKQRRENPDMHPVETFDVPVMENQDPETQALLESVR